MTTFVSGSSNNLDVPNLNIRIYRPGQSRYASRIPEEKWEKMRPDLEMLHNSGATRRQMLDHLAQQHGCRPTPPQLNARMVAWGMKAYKNMKATTTNQETKEITRNTSFTTSYDQYNSTEGEMEANLQTAGLSDPVHFLKGCISNLPNHIAIPDAQNFCILQDVADIFGHSGWGSCMSHNLMRALINTIELDHVHADPPTRLALLRNCLLWPAWWSSKPRRDWFTDSLNRMKCGISAKPNSEPCELVSEIAGPMCLHLDIHTVDTSIKEALPDFDMGRQIWPYDNTSLLAGCFDLEVHHHAPDLAYRFDASVVEDILSWCAKQLDGFHLSFNRTEDRALFSGSDSLFCRIELTRYLHSRWANFVAQDEVIVEEGRIDDTEREHSADLYLFRLIARVLSITSYLITSKTDTIFASNTPNTDPEFATKVKRAMMMAINEIESWHTDIFEQMRELQWSRPSIEVEEEQYQMIDNYLGMAKDVALVLVQQFHKLREHPLSHHNLAALRILRRQATMQETTQSCTGPNAMLWSVRSTSSFRSFRRAGISARDRFRPPSVSSVTSLLSRSSTKSINMMTQTIEEEWSYDAMDIDELGNCSDFVAMSVSKALPVLQQ